MNAVMNVLAFLLVAILYMAAPLAGAVVFGRRKQRSGTRK